MADEKVTRALARIKALIAHDIKRRFKEGDKQVADYLDRGVFKDFSTIERAITERDHLARIVSGLSSTEITRAMEHAPTEDMRPGK